jgi:hypothetical protein
VDDTPPPDLDDPSSDWFSSKTEADAPRLPVPVTARDPVTAPHPISGDVAAAFEAGRRQGFEAGIKFGHDDFEAALREVWEEHFGKDPVIRHTIGRIKAKLTPV